MRYIFAEVAQLIEHQPSKLRVASLSLVFRSKRVPKEGEKGSEKECSPKGGESRIEAGGGKG